MTCEDLLDDDLTLYYSHPLNAGVGNLLAHQNIYRAWNADTCMAMTISMYEVMALLDAFADFDPFRALRLWFHPTYILDYKILPTVNVDKYILFAGTKCSQDGFKREKCVFATPIKTAINCADDCANWELTYLITYQKAKDTIRFLMDLLQSDICLPDCLTDTIANLTELLTVAAEQHGCMEDTQNWKLSFS